MTRNFLRGLSLWIGALVAFVLVRIHYLDYVVRVRRWHPHAAVCGYDYFKPTVAALTLGPVLGMFLVAWFWYRYDRAGSAASTSSGDAQGDRHACSSACEPQRVTAAEIAGT